jgi:hypothetical protein
MSPRPLKRCQFCQKAFATQRAVNQHISASKICLKDWHKNIRKNDNQSPRVRRTNSPDEPILIDNPPDADPIDISDYVDNHVEADDQLRDESDDNLATRKRYVEPFPGPAGVASRREKTRFEGLLEIQRLEGKAPWYPFASRTEWGLVEWLMKNVGQRSTDEYLQLPIVSGLFVQ